MIVDRLIGVGDGAAWIDQLFYCLGVEQRILDVYHVTDYLDEVMLAMGWDEAEREAERRLWLRGEVNAREWFTTYLPPHRRAQWNREAQTALRYLETGLDQTLS